MYGPFWTNVTDHRPIFGCLEGIGLKRYSHMRHGPSKMPVQLRRIALSNFKDNHKLFGDKMAVIVQDMPPHKGAEEAGELLKTISRQTVAAVPRQPRSKLRRSTFKDGWSPYAVAGKTHLNVLTEIRRHLQGMHNRHRWRTDAEIGAGIKSLMDKWQVRVGKLDWKDKAIPAAVWGTGLTPREWCSMVVNRKKLLQRCKTDYALVRKTLHGRRRQSACASISHAAWTREQKLQERKPWEVINSMMGNSHKNFAIEQLALPPIILASGEKAPMSAEQVHRGVTDHIRDSYKLVLGLLGQPDLVNGGAGWDIAQSKEDFQRLYGDLRAKGAPVWQALTSAPRSHLVHNDLSRIFETPPTLAEFQKAIKDRNGHTSGGVSELSYNMVKEWPEDLTRIVYELLVEMWTDRYIPSWWRWRWLVPLPKKPTAPTLDGLRPIMLIEILRKLWAGLIMNKVHSTVLRHRALHPSQHGFQPGHGTDTANIQLINVMEEAKLRKLNLYGSSWDMRRAFDSVSKPIIRLAWKRLGVPDDIVDWLVWLDEDSKTVVKSSWAVEQWVAKGYERLAAEGASFHPETGVGQGDVFSPHTWVAVFDIVLCALDRVDHPDGFMLTSINGDRYRAPAVCYADDVISVAATMEGLQA